MSSCPNCGKEYGTGQEICPSCGFVFPFITDTLPPGALLQDRYEIINLAHIGGMGYVYTAWDKRLYDRPCIVKQVKEQVKSEAEREKLEEEARRMSKLNHPNVAMILDHFVENNYYFLVVESIPGQTLSEIYEERQGRLSEKEVVEWAVAMCKVVDYIHSEGVIHRDISPDNIMLSDSGIIKFVDFGTLRELRHITARGTAGMGKFGYAPPEQWQGHPVPQSDIFALGATIYYLLSGSLPLSQGYLSGKGPQKSDFNLVFPLVRTKNPAVSPQLEAVLQKALQPDVRERFRSAEELGQALSGISDMTGAIKQQSVESPRLPAAQYERPSRVDATAVKPTSASAGKTKTAPPWRTILYSLIGLAMLAIIVIVGVNALKKPDINSAQPAVNSSSITQSSKVVTQVPTGKIAYIYTTSTSGKPPRSDLYVINADGSGQKLLAEGAEAPSWSPDGKRIVFTTWNDNKCVIRVINVDGSNLIQLADSGRDPAWSPDGKKIAFFTQEFNICVMQPDSKKVTRLGENGRCLAWAPDSNSLLFVGGQSDNEMIVINVESVKKSNILSTEAYKSSFWQPSYSSDGKQIAFIKLTGSNLYELYVMNSDGSNQKLIADKSLEPWSPRWSPSGDRIAFATGHSSGFNNTLSIIKSDGTGLVNIPGPNFLNSISWSANGDKIAFDSNGIDILNADASGRSQLLKISRESADYIREVSWSPVVIKDNVTLDTTAGNGKIAFMSRRDGKYQVYTMNADGTGQKRLTDNMLDAGLPSWSPDAGKIAFRSGQYITSDEFTGFYPVGKDVYIIDRDGKNQRKIAGNSSGMAAPNWSPDGTQLAVSGLFGDICIVSLQDEGLKSITDRNGNLHPMWSPAGSKIIYQGFSKTDKMKTGIWAINADGSGESYLCDNAFVNWPQGWSPDGSQICYGSIKDGNYEIYIMDADGSKQKRLTNNLQDDWEAAWSPNGKMIAFSSRRDGNYEIYVMNADGSNQRRLTNNSTDNMEPAWSPDGKLIAFSSNRDGNYEIYVMATDGSNQVRLTNSQGDDTYPVWAPE